MKKYKLLDPFCGAGGASMGFHLAGFEITGIDHLPQKRYPFNFIQADALKYMEWLIKSGEIEEFDAIAGGPPCQFGSELTPISHRSKHPNLIPATRELMIASQKAYIIENVEGARGHLINPVMLCGSMFGLPIWRHRYFENNFNLFLSPAGCNHNFIPVLPSGTTRRKHPVIISGRGMRATLAGRRRENTAQEKRDAMDIPWMIETELTQAIPPAYTKWLGEKLIEYLNNRT
jgi:DNA (cytosine-5)-methyltransferase 1